jgi:hypothetical protein
MNFDECLNIINSVISKRDENIFLNSVKHGHHILPKHFGGKDEKSNIIELTIDEHAEVHRLMFEKFNLKEDWLAYAGLIKMIGKEEIIKEAMKIGSSKAGKIAGKKSKESGRLLLMSKKGIETFRKKFNSEEEYKEHFKKISKKQIGKPKDKLKDFIWITNGKENKKIKKGEVTPLEFYIGRTKFWQTGFSKEKKEKITCPFCNKTGGKPVMKRFHFEKCKLNKI